ncbi:galactose mutarotase [Flavobacteriaceae bacterium XHP0103]|uniref:aldose epimerase family protein n=1 Tax=Marixanthotalea marina TaxID=2844359 RepID=UPI002989F9FA|nr:aldose epimerase family protein [Marixanthotalea marina]MBU3823112.1 galactose mutarotase [Marixanthotalea marina]
MKTKLIVAAFLICNIVMAQTTKKDLGEHNGKEVQLFTLTNKAGNLLKLTNYGARIVAIEVPDKDGVVENVTTGGNTLETIVKGDAFGGATVGRYANRIANASFTLDGQTYSLPVNNRPNTLHGGPEGWFAQVWDSKIVNDSDAPSVTFTYISPDMEAGFPGTVTTHVTYTWTNDNEIVIDYLATTDKKTVFNITNHAYFNLNGTGQGFIQEHILTINASNYTPVDNTLIPTGEIKPVKDTPFDFTTPHTIGEHIGVPFEDVPFRGYDHNYVLDSNASIAATLYAPESGRVMEVITDEPGLQFYSGNSRGWTRYKETGEMPENSRSALALETQHFPDSPNKPNFPSTVLTPEKPYKSRTVYRFSVKR